MKRISIVAMLITLLTITGNVHSTLAQEGGAKVLVRQIGNSTYFYKVLNLSNKSIVTVMIGYNHYGQIQENEGNELLVEPETVLSPTGWKGYPVFLEESDYLHIRWRVLDYASKVSPGTSLDGFVVHMPKSYDLMRQATFSIIYDDGTITSAKVEIDTSTPILFDGKGQRPFDVNMFLAYLRPIEAQTTLPEGQTTYYLLIFYGKTILPETFKATLNGIDVTGSFHPVADTSEAVKLNLEKGKNTLVLSVNGIRDDGKQATDTDRLVFIVP